MTQQNQIQSKSFYRFIALFQGALGMSLLMTIFWIGSHVQNDPVILMRPVQYDRFLESIKKIGGNIVSARISSPDDSIVLQSTHAQLHELYHQGERQFYRFLNLAVPVLAVLGSLLLLSGWLMWDLLRQQNK